MSTRPQAPKIKEPFEFKGDIDIPSVSSVLALTEARLTEIAKSLGLNEWIVLWEPDETQPRGQIKPDNMIILVHDKEPEAAMKTLLHEALEIKLRPMLKPYRTLMNAFIEWADKQVYEAKERAIEDFLPILLKFVEDGYLNERSQSAYKRKVVEELKGLLDTIDKERA